jgi:hypothetical protein
LFKIFPIFSVIFSEIFSEIFLRKFLENFHEIFSRIFGRIFSEIFFIKQRCDAHPYSIQRGTWWREKIKNFLSIKEPQSGLFYKSSQASSG